MSRLSQLPLDFPVDDRSCCWCGHARRRGVFWSASSEIVVCIGCAVEMTGRLLADASADTVVDPKRRLDFFKTQLVAFEAVYWKGVAAAEGRRTQVRSGDSPLRRAEPDGRV